MRTSLVFLLVLSQLSLVALAQSPQADAAAAAARLLKWYDTREGQFDGVGWWHTGNCLTTIAEYALRSGNTSVITEIITDMYPKNGNFTTEGFDDEGWWGLAWIASYKLNPVQDYLTRAEAIFADMVTAWSTECGGGVWWNRAKTYKNAITNELFLSLAIDLYLLTNNTQYLTWAKQEWQWFNQSGLINKQYLINDGLLNNCNNNNAQTWTYNQGVILGGLVGMYQATGDKSYLVPAAQIANATMVLLSTSSGILQEVCEPTNNCDGDAVQFKGIFMRNLAYLYQATQAQIYLDYINNNAQSIWANDRSGNSLGLKWDGPYDTDDAARQSSALDAFNAALLG